jgi:hypothetical protein
VVIQKCSILILKILSYIKMYPQYPSTTKREYTSGTTNTNSAYSLIGSLGADIRRTIIAPTPVTVEPGLFIVMKPTRNVQVHDRVSTRSFNSTPYKTMSL